MSLGVKTIRPTVSTAGIHPPDDPFSFGLLEMAPYGTLDSSSTTVTLMVSRFGGVPLSGVNFSATVGPSGIATKWHDCILLV
ncbi:hypothetical protein ES703_122747 [subsurface metagenome]